MSDSQVSIDGTTHDLPAPFMVIATQNPYEFEGTYVLPESQMDRFLIRISMGYPDREFEQEIFNSHRDGQPIDRLGAVCSLDQVCRLQQAVRQVKVDSSISEYMLDVIHATRETAQLNVGVSTRGALLWYRATQARALIDGRMFAVPDDAKELAVAVLSHRVQMPGPIRGSDRRELETVIRELLGSVPVPT
jgi:MoxR-like ATPase